MRKLRGSEFPGGTTDELESWSSNPGWPAGQSALFFFNCTGSSFGLRTFSSCGMWEAPLGTVPKLFSLWSMGSRMCEPSKVAVRGLSSGDVWALECGEPSSLQP